MRRLRRVLTPANVIACTALFVALGGTGWAGQVIGRGAVGSTQLKSNAVTSSKIANGAVTKAKLAPGIGEGVAAGKITKVDAPIAAVPANSTGTVVTAVCPAGEGRRRWLERGSLRLPAVRGAVARRPGRP